MAVKKKKAAKKGKGARGKSRAAAFAAFLRSQRCAHIRGAVYVLFSVFLLAALSGGEEMPQGRAPSASCPNCGSSSSRHKKADACGETASSGLFNVDGLPERIARYAPLWFFADSVVTGQKWLLYAKFLSTPGDRSFGWHFLGWAAPRRKHLGPR